MLVKFLKFQTTLCFEEAFFLEVLEHRHYDTDFRYEINHYAQVLMLWV